MATECFFAPDQRLVRARGSAMKARSRAITRGGPFESFDRCRHGRCSLDGRRPTGLSEIGEGTTGIGRCLGVRELSSNLSNPCPVLPPFARRLVRRKPAFQASPCIHHLLMYRTNYDWRRGRGQSNLAYRAPSRSTRCRCHMSAVGAHFGRRRLSTFRGVCFHPITCLRRSSRRCLGTFG